MPFDKKYLFSRILGNDVPGLHGENQTIINLKFTLENESQYPNAEIPSRHFLDLGICVVV